MKVCCMDCTVLPCCVPVLCATPPYASLGLRRGIHEGNRFQQEPLGLDTSVHV